MKRLITFILIASCLKLIAAPGDTTYVKTFTFDSIHTRRAVFNFPETQSWEKIIMKYTLKCSPLTPWDSYDCGEWDYTTFTNVYEHTGVLDSTQYTHSKYMLNNEYFENFNGSLSPKYHKVENEYIIPTYNFSNPTNVTIGSNEFNSNIGISSGDEDSKTYFILSASELTTAGITAGEITNIKFNFENTDASNNIPINLKIAASESNSLSQQIIEDANFSSHYNGYVAYNGSGIFDIYFTSPFTWDGTSNLIFSISTAYNINEFDIHSYSTNYNSMLSSNIIDKYIDLEGNTRIEVPVDVLSSIDTEFSIALWVYGDPASQPQNDYLFEAVDNTNKRQLCVHYPWSDGVIYWDSGNDGTGYDRINKAANTSEFEGQWNHIVFTKNTVTGTMKIYLNGTLWHSGTGKIKPIQNISKFYIGNAAAHDVSRGYDGYMDDVSIWKKELSEEQIQELMYTKLDETHAEYNNLLSYYDFDETHEQGYYLMDKSMHENNAAYLGKIKRESYEGENRFKYFDIYQQLPVITITQGEYEYQSQNEIHLDSTLMLPQQIMEFDNLDYYTIQGIDTTLYYNNYDLITRINNTIDTIFYTPDVEIENSSLIYYSPAFEIINTIQIQNYVTPYGIGLSLGANGFTWTYDVTEYGKYLSGAVDISSHNTQELLDLTFVFIEGTPPRDILSFDQVHRGDYRQSDIVNDVVMPATKVKRNPDAEYITVRTRTTGHGMESANCAEFCPTTHDLSVEGVERHSWLNWTECSENPVQPQGGTWLYDRAGWCPGAFADTYNWDITEFVTATDSIEIDYGMTQYPGSNGQGNYRTAVQMIQYGPINFNNDAAINDIITPSNASIHSKYNPACNNPKIEIKNTGANVLNSAFIEYGINGDYSYTFQWTGDLVFLETEQVSLPVINWKEFMESNTFNVRISNPNNEVDEYEPNNYYYSTFEAVKIYTDMILLTVTTNNFGSETHYQVLDQAGNVLVNRDNLASNTTYNDTLDFGPGCYEIRIYDDGDDGLNFWAYQGQDGTGIARIKKVGGVFLKTFDPDFGRFINYQFIYPTPEYVHDQELNKSYFELYPNPNDGSFNIKLDFEPDTNTKITIYDTFGKVVEELSGSQLSSDVIHMNLHNLKNGVYFVNVKSNDINKTKKLVIK